MAYVVPESAVGTAEEQEVQITTWRQQLGERLPEYMVPSAFVVLDALPLTANGKVDRKALPAPDMSQHQNVYVAPTTATETLLCELWQTILGVEQVGVTDNFFRLGGHSLLLIQLLARLQEVGIQTDVRSLFSAATLGDLAARLDNDGENPTMAFSAPDNLIPTSCDAITPEILNLIELDQSSIDAIAAVIPGGVSNIQDIYPLAPLQEGILFHHQMSDETGDAYVMPVLLAAKTSDQRDKFLQALQLVINRHDVLRTAILWRELSQPVQVVCREVSLSVEKFSLDKDQSVLQQLKDASGPAQQYINIESAPLLRVRTADDTEKGEYFIFLQLHHIVSDHVGLEIIQSEIQTILEGGTGKLLAPRQYREFVAHALYLVESLDAKEFFNRKLGDITEPTAPFNLINVYGDGRDIVEHTERLPLYFSNKVRDASKRFSVSPAALFHAVYGLVLSACSGRDDVVFGTVVSGRLQGTTGVDRMLGMFINSLPYRLKLSNLSAQSLVLQAHNELQDLLPYEQIPLTLAQQSSGVTDGTPLFTAMLNYRHSSPGMEPESKIDAGISLLSVHERTNYPFTVSVDDLGQDFSFTAQVTDTIDPEQVVAYLISATKGLVDALEDANEKSALDIDVLPELERHQLMVAWNDTDTTCSYEYCVHQLFESQVMVYPEAIAVVFQGNQLTYSELNNRANQLAHYLVESNGVGPDTMVGICLERSIEMVVAIFGILKAGGAYVPLDPGYPEARLRYMLEDAALTTVITCSDVLARTPVTSTQALCLDDENIKRSLARQSRENIPPAVLGLASIHLAYVIYTSGSTGQPKGVLISHKNLRSSTFARTEYYDKQVSAFLLLSSIGFDSSVAGIFWTLTTGGKLCLVEHVDPYELEQCLVENKVSHMLALPSLYRELLLSWRHDSLVSLDVVVVAGEKCTKEVLEVHRSKNINCSLFNEYGPTEGTVWSSVERLDSLHENVTISIGKPIGNARFYVLDAFGRLAPKGVLGELYIGGDGVARGYLNNDKLTAQVFLKNPLETQSFDRVYKTGDLVKWLPNGSLDFLGRVDDQIKIRGFRVELSEIENTLLLLDELKGVVVVSKDAADGGVRLVAYLLKSERYSDSDTDLMELSRDHASRHLPDYMLPSAFVVLDVFPLSSNGKVDRNALPMPIFNYHQDAYVAPRTVTEKVLSKLWGEVLDVDKVGIYDNFFRLGGHSLLLVKLLGRLQENGYHAHIRDLFDAPTLTNLAKRLDDGDQGVGDVFRAPENLISSDCKRITPDMLSLVDLNQSDIDVLISNVPGGNDNIQDIYPLAPLQAGILFHHQMSEGRGDPYVSPSLLFTESRKLRDDFLNALQMVVDRHDVLRTGILWEGLSQPVQVVYRSIALPVEQFDAKPNEEVLQQLTVATSPAEQFMDITKGPLLRVELADDIPANKFYMILRLHHIISDHVGLEIIQKEVRMILQSREKSLTAPVPYREFVAHVMHQQKNLNAEQFFSEKLGDVVEATAPFNLLDVHGDSDKTVEFTRSLSPVLSKRIRASARHLGVSSAAVFHSIFGLVVGVCSGRDDVVFGTVLSGRLQGTYGADEMMGMFINTLPCRLKLLGNSVQEVVTSTHAELKNLLPFEQASLATAQQCSGLPNGSPLFSAMLNFRYSQHVEGDGEPVSDLGVKIVQAHERTNYPFAVSIDDTGEGFFVTAQVNNAVDPERVANYLVAAAESVVSALENSPDKKIMELSVLPEDEVQRLMFTLNDTAVDYSKARCIHELFEDTVVDDPGAIAVRFGDNSLTYGELNRKANQMANYLLAKREITPDSLVGVCFERSLEMVIAVFGVLKAGAAYVPLDPEYPEERLHYILDDTAMSTVIVSVEVHQSAKIAPSLSLCFNTENREDLDAMSCDNLATKNLGVTAKNLAYIIYTSGSTGRPKGVMIEHGNANALLNWARDTFTKDELRGVLAATSLNFDLSVFEMFLPLSVGGSVILVKNALDLLHTSPNSRITLINTVPSVISTLLANNAIPDTVKTINLAGEYLRQDLVEKLYDRYPGCVVNDLYGPSEDTTYSTFYRRVPGGVPRIGLPIANTRAYILGTNMKVQPIGIVGELYLAGDGLARGYLNRLDLTEEKFFPYSIEGRTDEVLYKTGDLARWASDGSLEYVGRSDHQIKLRGFRIELGEIENTLLLHKNVSDVVVVVLESDDQNRIVAYVVLESSTQDDASLYGELRDFLSKRLPEYMLPSIVMALDNMPLTPNGKVDRKSLPSPDGSVLQNGYLAPVTRTERVLCDIWGDLLGFDRVGVNDNFFHLGGHSLLLIQLLSRLQEADYRTDVRTLFGAASLRELAQSLDHNAGDVASTFRAPENLIPPDCEYISPEMLSLVSLDVSIIDRIVSAIPGGVKNISDIYPLAPLQEGILFHHQMSEGRGDTYVMPVLLAAKTRVLRDNFLEALQYVISRHDVLRTAILWDGLPQPVQVVCKGITLDVESFILDPSQEVMPQLVRATLPENQCMNISQAPLIRVRVADDVTEGRYFILLQLHHIASDHVGLEIIQSEVQAYLNGETDALIKPRPYREFVAHTLHQAKFLDSEKFFLDKLGTVSEPTAPFGLLDILCESKTIVECCETFPSMLSQRIRSVSRQLSVSPAALFHAVFGLVVKLCSGRDDVVFGTVLSGRLQGTEGAEHVMGMFINTLPFRVAFTDVGVTSMVQHVQEELSQLLAYEQASLALAQQCSGLDNGVPLFSAIFNYRHSSPVERDSSVAESDFELLSGQERTNYPFTVSLDDLGEDFSVSVQVNNMISPETIANYIITAAERLVLALEHSSDESVLGLDLLPEVERNQQLNEWSGSTVAYPKDQCIHSLFEAQVRLNPGAVAVFSGGRELTYDEINSEANQLAHFLSRGEKVARGDFVGVCLDRSANAVIAVLGVLKLGGVYVPLDSDYPKARLAHMIADTQLSTVITTEKVATLEAFSDVKVVCLDNRQTYNDIRAQSRRDMNVLRVGSTAQDAAYVIYTSGSTGNPKGVVASHRNVISLVVNVDYVPLSSDTIMLMNAPMTFDAATFEIWGALLNGGHLVVQPERIPDISKIGSLLKHNSVNTAWMTSGFFDQFAEFYSEALPKLHYLLVGGDVVNSGSVKKIKDKNSQLVVVNGYGPTENTTFSCTYQIEDTAEGDSFIPIGRPLPNRSVYVVSSNMTLQPTGVDGELLVGGDGLAQGYLNRAEFSAQKFVANPFKEHEGEMLYRTGDLVRWLPDGNLKFVGRIDSQVKIRGYRIELGEIEHTLEQERSVQKAVAVVNDFGGDKRIIAYVVSRDATNEIDTAASKRELERVLPEYMIPSAIMVLDSIPLTSNGKIDRHALPVPDISDLQEAYVPAVSDTERALCRIWEELLQRDRIGIKDNFFSLGGHSLLAIRMLAHIEMALNTKITVRSVFEHPCVSDLARLIDTASCESSRDEIVIQPRAVDTSIPLSLVQQSYWFLYKMEDGGSLYNTPITLHLSGALKVSVLEKALLTLVSRHENLRTRVITVDGVPKQVVGSIDGWTLPIVDTDKTALLQLVERHSREAFVLESEFAFRVALFCFGEDEFVLNMVSHHAFMDGWSMDILVREVASFYETFSRDEHPSYTPLAIQYGDYAVWQRSYLKAERYDAQLEFWRNNLKNLPPLLNLPTDYLRPPVQSYRGDSKAITISSSLSEALSRYAQRRGATLFHVLLTGIAVLLSRYARTEDVPIGTAIANRPHQDLEQLIGCFANTIVLRCLVERDLSFDELVERVKYTSLDAFSHSDVPFDEVVQAVKPERSLGVPPIFQVMFRLHNQAKGEGIQFDELSLKSFNGMKRTTVELDLNVSLTETPSGVQGEFAYSTDLFESTTIDRFIAHYIELLSEAVKDSARPVRTLEFLSLRERRNLISQNVRCLDYPQNECIHELFEAAAGRDPNKIAYICGDVEMSYAELNARSNKIARWLRCQGVGANVNVGLCVGRNVSMGVGLLAILKSGGTYVPIDPYYPKERLTHMISATMPMFILTDPSIGKRLDGVPVQTVCLTAEEHQWRDENVTNLEPLPNADHPAYVLFTSGTTGLPKGILVAHKSWRNMAVAHEFYGLSEEHCRVLQFSSLSFAVSLWNTFMAWAQGGTLIQVTDEESLPGESLYRLLAEKKVTTASLPASFLSVLPEECIPPSLQTVISVAEPCNDAIVSRLTRKVSQFYNMYGNSEVSMGSTLFEYSGSGQRLTLGTPFPNTTMYLLDDDLNVVPHGVVAEIYTGGVGLAIGYLNMPEETKNKFIPNPFSNDNSARLYKTGDLGRYLSSGEIEFIGREDFQVNLRGYRIELTEVEAAMRQCEGISDVAVILRDEGDGLDRLVCFYVMACDGVAPIFSELSDYLKKKLPSYMIPSLFIKLEAMPLTPNRKLDRLALKGIGIDLASESEFVSPSSDVERDLCAIWEETLGLDHVGLNDNFFQIGGHSLLALQLISNLNKRYERNFPVTALFAFPTVSEFSGFLASSDVDAGSQSCLQLMRSGNSASPPIFIVPGVGGSLLNLFELSDELSFLGNVYGLQAIGLDDATAPLKSIDDMARENIKAIQLVKISDPYILVGHSFGGWVVCEMARQMRELGHNVSLVLLDSPAPTEAVNEGRRRYADSNDYSKVDTLIEQIMTSSTSKTGLSLIEKELHERIRAVARIQAGIVYKPGGALSGVNVVVLRAWDATHEYSDQLFSWSQYFEEKVVFLDVKHDHFGILKKDSARKIREIMQEHVAPYKSCEIDA